MKTKNLESPGAPTMAAPKPRSRVSFNFDKKHGHYLPAGVKVGGQHSFGIKGTVTGVSSHEYGHSLDLDLEGAPTPLNQSSEETTPNSLTGSLRKRHGGTGRFVG